MRCKKKLEPNLSEDSHDEFVKEEQERPMSWEGELSDTEMSVVNGSGISLKNVSYLNKEFPSCNKAA